MSIRILVPVRNELDGAWADLDDKRKGTCNLQKSMCRELGSGLHLTIQSQC